MTGTTRPYHAVYDRHYTSLPCCVWLVLHVLTMLCMTGTARPYHAVYDRHYMYNMKEYNVINTRFITL